MKKKNDRFKLNTWTNLKNKNKNDRFKLNSRKKEKILRHSKYFQPHYGSKFQNCWTVLTKWKFFGILDNYDNLDTLGTFDTLDTLDTFDILDILDTLDTLDTLATLDTKHNSDTFDS